MKTQSIRCIPLFLLIAVFPVNLCYSIEDTSPGKTTMRVHDLAKDDPDMSTFFKAIDSAGLSNIFNGTGPFTAFIPSNAAFEKMDQTEWNNLLKPENKDALATFLIYHILPGKYLTRSLKTRSYRTINGKTLEVTVEGDSIKVNGAKIIKADMVGPNGVIHEIDAVLIAR